MLRRELVGKSLFGGNLLHENVLEFKEPLSLLDKVSRLRDLFSAPRRVKSVERVGKFIIIGFDPELALLVHFGFTGWIVPTWAKETQPRTFLHPVNTVKYERLSLGTHQGSIVWSDPRALGRTRVFDSTEEAKKSKYLIHMGPDADTSEGAICLHNAIVGNGKRRSRRRLRDLLMDQRVIAGLGNYLCCEVLNRAKFHGAEPANTLSATNVITLYEAIKECITAAETNSDHSWWRVFRRKETPDGNLVTREVWGNRGHYVAYAEQPPPENWSPKVTQGPTPDSPPGKESVSPPS